MIVNETSNINGKKITGMIKALTRPALSLTPSTHNAAIKKLTGWLPLSPIKILPREKFAGRKPKQDMARRNDHDAVTGAPEKAAITE